MSKYPFFVRVLHWLAMRAQLVTFHGMKHVYAELMIHYD